MKIAFLSRFQNKVDRGAETYVAELSKRLSKNNKVTILTGKDADSFRKMVSGKYDVIIPVNGRFQALKASLGRIFSKHKVIISGQAGIGRDDIWNIFISRPDVYIGLTNHESSWAKKWVIGVKVVTIPNGVDLEKFKPGKGIDLRFEKPIVLSVGALTWYKHHERTIKAMKNVDGTLLIVGSGPEEKKLKKLADKEMPGRVKIISAKYEDLPKIYRSADLFVLPSWDREAFGIVYVEAMASGLAVVAPDDAPRREIIGYAGILVDVKDPRKYADAIKEALQKDWGDKPRQQAEKFSWDKIAEEYGELIKSLC